MEAAKANGALKPGRHAWVGETREANGSETDQCGESKQSTKTRK